MRPASSHRSHFARRHPLGIALAVSIVGAIAYLIWTPQTLDLSAQTFRADLWDRDGFVVWNADWYGGHTIPGYSLIYPPLGAALGPALVGALSAVAATLLFGSLALRSAGNDAWLAVIWFGAASLVAPFGGRTTFALGLALGLLALWLVTDRRALAAALAALATSLASPVAGLFGAIAAAAVVAAALWGRGQALAITPPAWGPAKTGIGASVAALVGFGSGLAALAIAFPTPGYQPFAFSAYFWIPLAAVAVLVAARRRGPLRWGAAIYLAIATVALVVDTPLGGNVTRLGLTIAGPLLALLLARRRPLLLALLAVPLIWWQWTATVRDVAAASGEGAAVEAAFYAPLVAELERRGVGDDDRIEIPPTRNRWESVFVAERIPLARGWLRQLETSEIELFDGDGLSAEAYRGWLERNGVDWVALPDADRDYIAEDEAELIGAGLPYLRAVWENADWTLFRVSPKAPVESAATGAGVGGEPAEVLAATSDRVVVGVPGPGSYRLAIRWTPYFTVDDRGVCLVRDGEWTRVEVDEGPARELQVGAGLSLAGAFGRDRSCGATE